MNTYTQEEVAAVRSTFVELGSITETSAKLNVPKATVWGMVQDIRCRNRSKIEQARLDRAAAVGKLVAIGRSDQQIGDQLNLRATQVKWVRERHGIKSLRPHGKHPKTSEDDGAAHRRCLERADDAMQAALGAADDSFQNLALKAGSVKKMPRPDSSDGYVRSSMGYGG